MTVVHYAGWIILSLGYTFVVRDAQGRKLPYPGEASWLARIGAR